jgi:osmotically-inducible protein OsmY
MVDDTKIRRDVIAELEWDPRVDPAHVGVIVDEGVVTLAGHVRSLVEKQAAERAARRVRGVRALAVNLQVRLPSDRKWHDDEIARRAGDVIRWHDPELADRVSIRVERGVVTLGGTVVRASDRMAAQHDVLRLRGVVDVVNRIGVEPSADPADVEKGIRAAFERHAELEAGHVAVRVDGSTVILSGRVESWLEREMAECAAWAAPGIADVRNDIVVVS